MKSVKIIKDKRDLPTLYIIQQSPSLLRHLVTSQPNDLKLKVSCRLSDVGKSEREILERYRSSFLK